MSYIHSTEFSCHNCNHIGHFYQEYQGYKVSNIATCSQCRYNIDVSRAKGIEKWNKRLSFALINTDSTNTTLFRIGGKEYSIRPGGRARVNHYCNELVEIKFADNTWNAYTSVWYFCFEREWASEIDVELWAYHQIQNIKTKKSWW